METNNLISAVMEAVCKVALTALVVYIIYQGATTCYDYGYRIFTEPAVSAGTGREVTVAVTDDMSPLEIGELFAGEGLVKDAKLFALQFLFSEYREDFRTGVYDLSTSMTAEEMMEVMSTPAEGEETADKQG